MYSLYRILIFSEDPDKLMAFYRDVLKFTYLEKVDIPNDYGHMLQVTGKLNVWVGKHSEIEGKVKEPFRHIYNLYVESVTQAYKQIKDHEGVTIVCKPELTPFATKENSAYVSTFLDPEGNCWQFMGKK